MSEQPPEIGPEMESELPPPFALSMMICDSISVDLASGKLTLHGCFDKLFAGAFPVAQPLMMLYVAMTNGHGEMPLKAQLVDVDEQNAPLFTMEGKVQFPDPLAILELRVPVPFVVFPAPGEYRFQLYAGGKFIIERRLTLVPIGGVGP